MTEPRVWVGCLGCYNEGALVGEWFDALTAPEDEPDWRRELTSRDGHHPLPTAHYAEAHEELWVFDHEGFSGLLVGEASPLIAKGIANALEAIPEHQRAPYAAYVVNGYDPSDFEDAYQGEWDSFAEYVESYLEDTGMLAELPGWAQQYLDVDKFARDWQLGGDYWTTPAEKSGVFIFRAV